jgi:hypothetical protein
MTTHEGQSGREVLPLAIMWRNPQVFVQAQLRGREASDLYYGWAEQARKIRARRANWDANHSCAPQAHGSCGPGIRAHIAAVPSNGQDSRRWVVGTTRKTKALATQPKWLVTCNIKLELSFRTRKESNLLSDLALAGESERCDADIITLGNCPA